MAWPKNNGGEISSSFAKFLSDEENRTIAEIMHFEEGDLLLIVADANKIVFDSLGALRCEAARRLGLIRQGEFKLLWVTEFPLLEYSEDDGRYYAKHHPFTMPMEEELDALEKGENLDKIRSIAYDIAINGTEAGGGSVRISRPDIQKKVFKALGMTEKEAQSKFGFLLEAYKYGAPPHAGMAFGFDRLVALLLGIEDIRDVIAFPKVQNASELMTKCPTPGDSEALAELGISITEKTSN